jgi:hypothetical protein
MKWMSGSTKCDRALGSTRGRTASAAPPRRRAFASASGSSASMAGIDEGRTVITPYPALFCVGNPCG